MVKIVGLGGKRRGKKRLSPSARTRDGIRREHPMYQYALNEYAQAAQPGTQNDEGTWEEVQSSVSGTGYYTTEDWRVFTGDEEAPSTTSGGAPNGPSSLPVTRSNLSEQSDGVSSLPSRASDRHPPPSSTAADFHSTHATAADTNYSGGANSDGDRRPNHNNLHNYVRSPFEADLPDATYEEYYGDAYVGQPLKYVYPSGYQSMRPRSCPWKLSIIVCLLFTWLSVFIVGHCSDQVDQSQYYQNDEIDDAVVIEIRWCGSRPLYLMWVTSMLITGLAAAYCSVIGYIKVRDFAVANARSQPPGVIDTHKSDFYVRIDENSIRPAPSQDGVYRKSIYQSDGTPQFWGAHIYKPTQAAVAITSR